MGIGIAVLLSEKRLPTEKYFAFVNACTSIIGDVVINELQPLNLNADDIVHDYVIMNRAAKLRHDESRVRVLGWLERREFMKKYGRSRRKIFWQIYIETKAGRSSLSLALQLLIPLQAFTFFTEPVVVVDFDPEKVFLERKTYKMYAARQIALACGEDFINTLGLEIFDRVAPNKSLDRSHGKRLSHQARSGEPTR
jgi:hypothetical protein